MSFCSYSSDYLMDTTTAVDNIFLAEYLGDAPKSCSDVYLYGLYLCGGVFGGDNSAEVMARALNLEVSDVIDSFTYWQDLGLVNIIHTNPVEVKYLPLRSGSKIVKKIKPGKYKDFNALMQSVISGRMIGPNEYYEYYLFLETAHAEPEALVMIAKYCVDLKGEDISSSYILAVARNMAAKGCKTVETVDEHFANHSKYNPALDAVLKASGARRQIEYEDRTLYAKWTDEFGFSEDAVLKVAKQTKNKGGVKRLDTLLSEYYKLGLTDIKEIERYRTDKENLYALAKAVNKIIGVYYESLDYIVETYFSAWKNKGFTDEALTLIAKSCFTQNIRTLDGMNTAVENFYKNGLITAPAITQHIEKLRENDRAIRAVLDELGLVRSLTASDRAAYKTWSQTWSLPADLILYAASLSPAAAAPVQYMSRILSSYKDKNITSVEAAKASSPFPAAPKPAKEKAPDFPQHEYSKEELDALFDDIDSI